MSKRNGTGNAIGWLALAAAGMIILLLMPLLLLAGASAASDDDGCATTPSAWASYALAIAEDDSHGYSQPNRGGDPDYDCSSLVWYALKKAGLDVGDSPFTTRTMRQVLENLGFTEADWNGTTADLQAGDILWGEDHTEIYAGDEGYVGARHDENGGVIGGQPGDQTGEEIAVSETAPSGLSTRWRAPSTLRTNTSQDATGALDGLTIAQTLAWFDDDSGPCYAYPAGQCTWWACMRARKLGWQVGSHWGNGGDWGASGAAAGHRTSTTQAAPGAIISFPPGTQGADPTYGHVAVVETVDEASGTITISEMNVKGPIVSSRRLPIANGGTYVLPDDADGVTAGTTGVTMCRGGDEDGENADAATAKAIARRKIGEHGWDDAQYQCLEQLWDRESGWRFDAENPTSGAYGIPQALPGGKMATAGDDWRTNAATQIQWGLDYIRDRYGTPCEAWDQWQSRDPHWY